MRTGAGSALRATLVVHAATLADGVTSIEVRIACDAERIRLDYRIAAHASALRISGATVPARRDELWRHTCCELFVASAHGEAYREFNFAPSGEWAAYTFTARREGMAPLEPAVAPRIDMVATADAVVVRVALARGALAPAGIATPLRLGLAAVIEDRDGGLSYWALAHPGSRPDFHDPAGFTLALPGA